MEVCWVLTGKIGVCWSKQHQPYSWSSKCGISVSLASKRSVRCAVIIFQSHLTAVTIVVSMWLIRSKSALRSRLQSSVGEFLRRFSRTRKAYNFFGCWNSDFIWVNTDRFFLYKHLSDERVVLLFRIWFSFGHFFNDMGCLVHEVPVMLVSFLDWCVTSVSCWFWQLAWKYGAVGHVCQSKTHK